MFSFTPDPDTDPETAADNRRAADVAVLDDTAKLAHALAGAFQHKALKLIETADTPQEHAAAVAYGRAFDHSARTLRQTLALKTRLADHEDAFRRQAAQVRQTETHALEVESAARRAAVGLAVAAAIEAARRPRAETERLLADLDEGLDAFEDEIFLELPIGQIAKTLCEAGGVPADLTLWQDHPWAREEIQLRPKGSPFAGAWRMADDAPASDFDRFNDPMARPP